MIRAMDTLCIPFGDVGTDLPDKANVVRAVDYENVTSFEEPYVSYIKVRRVLFVLKSRILRHCIVR